MFEFDHLNLSFSMSDMDRIAEMARSMTLVEMAKEVFGGAEIADVEQMATICTRNGITPRRKRPTVIDGTTRRSSHARAGEGVASRKLQLANDPVSRLAAGRTAVVAREETPPSRVMQSGKSGGEAGVAPAEPAAPVSYRLRSASGEYLNARKAGLTGDSAFAWQGSAKDVESVLFKECRSSALTVEPVL